MDNNYLDFGTPISFGWTAQYLDTKTQTRRQWKDSHAAKILRAYDRATAAGQQLRVPAIDTSYTNGGKQIGWCVLTLRPYKESPSAMGYADLVAEGGMCRSVDGFIKKYFKGDRTTEVWVLNFAFYPLPDCQIEYAPLIDREIYADIEARILFNENVSVSEQMSPPIEDADDADDAPETPIKSCCISHQSKPRTQFLEFDPEYDDAKYDRELAIKRYLRLIESPIYRVDLSIERFTESGHSPPEKEQRGPKPKPLVEKNLSLPSNLDLSDKKIGWGTKKKILAALAIWPLPRGEVVNVRTLFAEVKFRGFEYNYKSQTWEYQYRARSTN